MTKGRLPTSLSELPEVAKAEALYCQTKERLNALQDRTEELAERIENGRLTDTDDDSLAAKVLAGESLTKLGGDAGKLVAELAEAKSQERILAQAVGLAEQRLSEAKRQAEAKLVAQVKASYREIVGRLAKALIALRTVADEEASFRHQYYSGELAFFPGKIYPMALPFDADRIEQWLADGAAFGVVDAATLAEFKAKR